MKPGMSGPKHGDVIDPFLPKTTIWDGNPAQTHSSPDRQLFGIAGIHLHDRRAVQVSSRIALDFCVLSFSVFAPAECRLDFRLPNVVMSIGGFGFLFGSSRTRMTFFGGKRRRDIEIRSILHR